MKLNFKLHIKEKISKAMKGICIIKKLSNAIPRKSLITIYKSFVRPHLDYSDLIYDQPNNESYINNKKYIMLPLQSLVLLKEHLDLNYTMKLGWSLLNLDNGLENLVPFTKLKVLVCLHFILV